MLSLRETQAGFARALFSGVHGACTPGIRSDGLSPALRLGFYRTTVTANYLDALRATYCAVERAVGRPHFDALAQRYIREYPSRSGDLNAYGGEFAQLLARAPVAQELPWLPDLARLERAIDEAFYDADHAPLSLEKLAQVAPEEYDRLVFRLHPACRLLRCAWPVRGLWEASQAGAAGTPEAAIDEGGELLLVRRAGFEVVIDALRPADFAMLWAFHAGASFAAAYAAAGALDARFDPGAFLQRHVASATLVDIVLAPEPASEESLSAA